MSPFRSPESRGAEARAWLLLLLTAGAAAYPAIWLAGWNPYAGRLRVGAAEAVLNGSDLRIASYQDGRLTAEMRAEAVSAGSGAQAFLLTGMTGSFGDASATASQAVWTPRIGALEASPGLRLKLDGATAVFERTSTITADGWKTDGPIRLTVTGRGGPMTMTATGASRASRASAILFKGLTGQTADRRKFELAAGSLDLKTGLLRADQMLVTDPRGGRLRLSQAEWNRSTDTLKGIRAQHEQGGRRIEAAEITVTGQRLTARGPVISGSGFRLTGASLESPDQGRTARIEGGARVSGSGWEAESATLTSAAEGSVVLTGNPLVRFTPRQGGTGEARALKITLQGRPEQATITLEGRTSARWNGPDLQLSATMDRLTAQVRGGDLRWTGLGNPAELSIPGETTQRARGIEMHMQPDGRVEVKMTGVTGEFSR